VPTQYADNPSPEVAAERDRIMWIFSRYLASPLGTGVQSKTMTAINSGYTPAECEQRWGHPFVDKP
jgi:hypothetical protein